MFQQDGQGRLQGFLVDAVGVEHDQGLGPVDSLGDAGVLLQVEPAHALHDIDGLPRQLVAQLWHAHLDDIQFGFMRGIIDEEVEAATLEGLAKLAGVIAGEDDDRMMPGLDGAQLGDADLEVAEDLQQESLELGIRAVDLVDEQDDWLVAEQCRQQWPRQQEALAEEDIVFIAQPVSRLPQGIGFCQQVAELIAQQLRVEHLLGVFPFIERFVLVQAFITLQADQSLPRRARPGLGQLRLADAGWPLDQERFAQLLRQEDDRGDLVRGDILLPGQGFGDLLHIFEYHRRAPSALSSMPRRV